MSATYTLLQKKESRGGSYRSHVQIAYAAEPYAAGLFVDKAKLGLPDALETLQVETVPGADTNQYKVDLTNSKIRIYAEAAGTYAEVAGNQTVTLTVIATGW